MNGNFAIMHDIPGRLRIIIPPLGDNKDYEKMEEMFASLSGVKKVRIEPIIRSMLIEYDLELMERKVLLGYISLFFEKTWCDPIDNLMGKVTPSIRKDLFRSVISGFLLLLAFTRKSVRPRPDIIDYAVVISTGYTVLSHGNQGQNKLGHPDIITGIITMLSLGTQNILQVSFVTWAVNLFEIFYDMYRTKAV
ncbi:hypothetical protein J2S74_004743 [Evansella vedderi]|uniref:Uncharacterized protein n=1 Tax=Evansella vedderi TaxID=38282 RepID=A0ABU0A228_9BACI|nr:hypothetical protein [Evansella vedderi]MDQ0257285.1 hypothetical protein [Evansella vedderi]